MTDRLASRLNERIDSQSVGETGAIPMCSHEREFVRKP